MARHSFQPRTSIFPRFRALLREISPFIFSTLLFLHSVKTFSFRASLILHALLHLHISIDFLSALHSPSLFTPSPLSFSFLPTFPSPSPIYRTNARTLAQYARTRTLARQEVFVYCLHRFTTPRNPLCTNALGVKENEKKSS